MNIDKISVSNPFKGRQMFKKVSTAAVVTAASALYAASEKEGIDSSAVIDEYYRNEFAMRNKKYDIRGISRFSPEERLEFLQMGDDLEFFSKALHRIVSAKNDNGEPRFNGEESLLLFQESCKPIENNPELFNKILAAKDNEGDSRFNAQECAMLMQNSKIFLSYPSATKAVLSKNFDAEATKDIMLSAGEILEGDTSILDEALNRLSQRKQANVQKKDIINTIKNIDLENQRRRIKAEREEKLQKIAENAKRQAEREEKEAERKRIAQEAAQQKAELKAAKLAKEKRIKQERIDFLNKQFGWVAPEILFEKVNKAADEKTPLVLESGEVLPDEIRDKIAKNIQLIPGKAARVVNLRYHNNQPIFNEKQCCEVISELEKYLYIDLANKLKCLDFSGQPFFNAEQCKEILQLRSGSMREFKLNYVMNSSHYNGRAFSASEVIEIMKNELVYNHKFADLVKETYWDGTYKYTVAECIEKCRI